MPSFCYWFEQKATLPADDRTDCRLPGLKFQTHTMYDRKCTPLKGAATELHALPIERIAALGLKEAGTAGDEMQELFHHIKEKLYPFMRPEARKDVSRRFERFLGDERHRNAAPVLIHGDFGAPNIVWDEGSCRITGIIDFGGSGLGDPAYDLAGLLSAYGEVFFRRCVALYSNGDEMAERAFFYRSTFALQEALHGIEHNDREAFESGMRGYLG